MGDRVGGADDDYVDFVRASTPGLLRSAYLLTGDQQLAEDLVQSALARTYVAWQRVTRFDSADAYTRKVMYHLQVDRWRRKRFAEFPYEAIRAHSQPDHAAATALRLDVAQALQRLTAKQRAVITSRFFDDRTEAETAAILGCTVGTVKSQTAKALARLRTACPDLAPEKFGARAGRSGEGVNP